MSDFVLMRDRIMCIEKRVAKVLHINWAIWKNQNSNGDVVSTNLGYSSDGNMSADRLMVASSRDKGLRLVSSVALMPEDVQFVDDALKKLDSEYQQYAEVFFRWKIGARAKIGECIELYCNDLDLSARQYSTYAERFYLKICAVLA